MAEEGGKLSVAHLLGKPKETKTDHFCSDNFMFY